jgi:hypothetical protein
MSRVPADVLPEFRSPDQYVACSDGITRRASVVVGMNGEQLCSWLVIGRAMPQDTAK